MTFLVQSISLLAVPLICGGLGRLAAGAMVRNLSARDEVKAKVKSARAEKEKKAGWPPRPQEPGVAGMTVILDLTLTGKVQSVKVHTEIPFPVSEADIKTALDTLNKQAAA
jgi:hypothetical protein